jgi:hypothetical protein
VACTEAVGELGWVSQQVSRPLSSAEAGPKGWWVGGQRARWVHW